MNRWLLRVLAWLLVLSMLCIFSPGLEWVNAEGDMEEEVPSQQSTTGPYPPLEVLLWDQMKALSVPQETKGDVVLNTPAYRWRHGCGPTALGMVVGYYDTKGYANLIPGDAWTQTAAVNQMIASGGDDGAPFPAGSEQHYEDYVLPKDSVSKLLVDNYITAGRDPHTDNSIADYLGTSRSTLGNPYGWSWSTEMGRSFVYYFNTYYPGVTVEWNGFYDLHGTMTWEVLVQEINAGRPMVFLVDTSGDGVTDHFVMAIGYRTNPTLQYAVRDTWSISTVRWENFRMIKAGVPWGIWGGYSYKISHPPTDISLSNQTLEENINIGSQVGTLSTADPLMGDIITYSFVSGNGDSDNALFQIVGNQLLTSTTIDYETRSGYSVRVRSTDSGGDWVEKSFNLIVQNQNEAPTDIQLTIDELVEEIPAGSVIGELSTIDQDADESFLYTLDNGSGDDDNTSFQISGDQLLTTEEIDFGEQAQYSILVRSSDLGGLFIQKIFVIRIDGVNGSYIHAVFVPMLVR